MKRFHVHVHVDDLPRNLAFYSALFGAAPSRTEADYAKWMLEDPRLNFAISSRGLKTGVDHLGLQVDSAEELAALRGQMSAANISTHSDGETTCCYAKSEKSWVQDPSGIAWEAYHTMEDAQLFSTPDAPPAQEGACCAPAARPQVVTCRLPASPAPVDAAGKDAKGCC